jgi:serine protease AprX
MRWIFPGITSVQGLTGLWLFALAVSVYGGVLSPDLERAMARRGTHADTAVIVRMADPLDMEPLANVDRSKRDNRLLVALKERSAVSRTAVEPLLSAHGATLVKDLWIVNALAATLPAFALKQLAGHPAIARIDPDTFVQGGRSQRSPLARAPVAEEPVVALSLPASQTPPQKPVSSGGVKTVKPGWNIVAVQAPEVWALGHTGKGVVVASMDTGVDLAHPDLQRKWRGGTNSWFDPHGEEARPYDTLGHGTQALGVVVGGPEIGVAPDAQWIAVRLYNGKGRASMSDIHLAFQWLMDPDGDPATIDAPDVINASWALTGRGAGACILEFYDDILALKAAGIAVVFAAGNDGPAPKTSNSPGNNPGVMSIGAIDRYMEISRQTSRGPSACDGAVFPALVAPGINVRTADLSHGGQQSYTTVSGSSLAAPHASGVLALLAGAFPDASVAELEAALRQSGLVLPPVGNSKADNPRRLDALAAFNALRAILEVREKR